MSSRHINPSADRPHTRTVLVVGASRSGTTVMGRILGRNADVYTYEELHLVGEVIPAQRLREHLTSAEVAEYREQAQARADLGLLAARQNQHVRARTQATVPGGPALTGAELFHDVLVAMNPKASASVACEQTPQNLYYADDLLRSGHDHVVAMVRDPRDVLLSQKNRWRVEENRASVPTAGSEAAAPADKPYTKRELLRYSINYHPILMSILWNRAVRSIDALPADRAVVQFEDLIADPEATVRRVCDAVGLTYCASMLNVEMKGSSTDADVAHLGLRSQTVGRWRDGLTPTEIWLCERMCKRGMTQWGYVASGARPRAAALAALIVSLPVKLALALLINRGHTTGRAGLMARLGQRASARLKGRRSS